MGKELESVSLQRRCPDGPPGSGRWCGGPGQGTALRSGRRAVLEARLCLRPQLCARTRAGWSAVRCVFQHNFSKEESSLVDARGRGEGEARARRRGFSGAEGNVLEQRRRCLHSAARDAAQQRAFWGETAARTSRGGRHNAHSCPRGPVSAPDPSRLDGPPAGSRPPLHTPRPAQRHGAGPSACPGAPRAVTEQGAPWPPRGQRPPRRALAVEHGHQELRPGQGKAPRPP